MKIRWYHWPILITGTILIFAILAFILMGVNLFPGYDGGRWAVLGTLVFINSIIWVINSSK